MNQKSITEETQSRLRLWPAWIIAVSLVIALVLSVTPAIANQPRFFLMAGGPLLSALLMSLWVLFASRLGIWEKLFLALAAILLPILSMLLSLPTEATRSAIFIYGLPLAVLATTLGLTIWSQRSRRVAWTVGLMALGWGVFPFLRNDGFDGDYFPEFTWRWSPIHEQSLPSLPSSPELAESVDPQPAWAGDATWTVFRGPSGNGVADVPTGSIDWQANPPKELWRIDVGPGWSSFSYHRGRLFTQEQRGEKEYVTCYRAEDGQLLWSHGDATRFEEVVSGAGPRSTPTVADGRVIALGARAMLSCLDEQSGSVLWQRDLEKEVQAKVPTWAFSGSPLVVGDLAIIYAGGSGDNGLIAVETESGRTRWSIASKGENYATPRLFTLSGVECLVFCDSRGVHGLDSSSGQTIWSYMPRGWKSAPMVDAQQIDENRILVALGDGVGMACLHATLADGQWKIEENWSTTQLRPSFNDSLISDGMIFGFNQHIYSCIDAETGKRKWTGGRYGFGQAILLKNSKTIVVASEKGEAIFLQATGDKLTEVHRQMVLDDKTWNHPIAVGNRLFMRNAKTACCLQLWP